MLLQAKKAQIEEKLGIKTGNQQEGIVWESWEVGWVLAVFPDVS